MRRFLTIGLVTLLANPALAATTPWQDLAPGVRARLISTDVINSYNGKTQIGLELDMPKTTRTYWRIPGETGIPPQLDFSGSRGVGSAQILWPYPEIDRTAGYLDFVYRGHTIIPVEFKTAEAAGATVDLSMTLGVCSDVCVPAQAKFTLPVAFGKTDQVVSTWIAITIPQTPDTWTDPAQPFGTVTAVPGGLLLAGIDASVDPASIIADVGDPAVVFDTPQKSPDNRGWLLKLLGDSDARGLVGRNVQLTFISRHIPYAVSRPIQPAS